MRAVRNLTVLRIVAGMIRHHELYDWVFPTMFFSHPIESSHNERMWWLRSEKAISRFKRHVHIKKHHEWVGRVLSDRIPKQITKAQIHIIARFSSACLTQHTWPVFALRFDRYCLTRG